MVNEKNEANRRFISNIVIKMCVCVQFAVNDSQDRVTTHLEKSGNFQVVREKLWETTIGF